MSIPKRVAIVLLVAEASCGGDLTPGKLGGAGDQEAPPPISLSPPADQDIAQRLTGIFAEVDGLQDVRVRVRDSVVRLDGEVGSTALKQSAAAIAERVEGVAHLDNDIATRPDVSARLAPTRRTLRGFWSATLRFVPQLGAAVLVFLPFLLLSVVIGRWRRPLHRLGVNRLTGRFLRYTLRGLVLVVGVLVALDILGLVGIVGAVVGAVGILALIASLAFRGWVENYFPGMMLGLHPPFHTGDLVEIGSTEGRVIRITPRSTMLMTLDGEEVQIPNVVVYRETLINYSNHRERRLRFTVVLSPLADLREAQAIGRRALLDLRGVMSDPPPFMRTRTLERDSIEVEFFAWVDQDELSFRVVEARARRAVFEALHEHGVPLPEQVVVLERRRPGAARQARPPEAIDDADARDQAFLDEQLDRARSARGERDLLAEGATIDGKDAATK